MVGFQRIYIFPLWSTFSAFEKKFPLQLNLGILTSQDDLARSCHRPPRLTVQDHPGRSREVLPVPPPTVYTQFAVNCAVSCTSEKPKDDWPTGWLNICALSPSICPDYQSPHISTCRTTPPHTLKHVCSSPGSIPTKFARSRKRDLSTALAVSTPTE